jgi:hypothetical protein
MCDNDNINAQIGDDEVPISRLSLHAAAPLPADNDDDVPIPRFLHHTALVSCYGDAEVPLLRPSVSCLSSSPSPLLFALNLPWMLVADALSGMVDSDVLLLLNRAWP